MALPATISRLEDQAEHITDAVCAACLAAEANVLLDEVRINSRDYRRLMALWGRLTRLTNSARDTSADADAAGVSAACPECEAELERAATTRLFGRIREQWTFYRCGSCDSRWRLRSEGPLEPVDEEQWASWVEVAVPPSE